MSSEKDLGFLDPNQWQQLHELVNQFEKACAASEAVELAQFLPPAQDVLRPVVLEELIKSDLENRWRKGKPAFLESYLEKHPELGSRDTLSVQLIFEEYWVRKRNNDQPDLLSYRERFPEQFERLKLMVQETNLPSMTGDSPEEPVPDLTGRLRPGELLPIGDGYRLVRRLGAGNFGQVWEAETAAGKPVAVKVLSWPMDHPAAQRERQALEVIKKLNHPYLLDVHNYYTLDNALVIVTRLADGNLKDRLKECKRQGLRGIPTDELLRHMMETAEVLDYLNAQGIQHRDIKPENLLLCQGHVAAGDLGLARFVERQQAQVSVLGTPPYMAPEVWLGQIHTQSDQYSLAITYVELRRGRCPFNNANVNGLTAADLKESPELEPLKEAERAVLLRAGAVESGERYGDCRSFVEALRQALQSSTASTAFKKVKRIGKGAFGEVWQGEAPGGVACAIKVIPSQNEEKSKSEIDALELIKQLSHPYLVKVYACWLDEGEMNIAMELADRSLVDRLNECRKQGLAGIPREELLSYFRHTAEGLDYLHAQRVLHRDIKPGNILLQGSFAKVADFGVARLIQEQHLFSATTSGTMAYMPPEAWRGKYSIHSDQYSLAVAYGEMRLGDRLFSCDSPAEAMESHLHRQPPLGKLPEAEQRVLLKALAKEPENRYPSCKAFVEALEKAAAGNGTGVGSPIENTDRTGTILPGGDRGADPEASTQKEVSASASPPRKGGWKAAPSPTEIAAPPAAEEPPRPRWGQPAAASPARSPARVAGPAGKKMMFPGMLILLLVIALIVVLVGLFLPDRVQRGMAYVKITSEPDGARVFVDGQEQTDDILVLKPGKYLVRLEKPGYKPFEKNIEVERKLDLQPFHFSLEIDLAGGEPPGPKKHRLTISTSPIGAKIYLDGKEQPQRTGADGLNLELDAGRYDVKLELDENYFIFRQEVQLPGTSSLVHDFEPITLSIKSNPPGAKVLIGDKEQTKPTDGKFPIAAGSHVIEINMDGYQPIKKAVVISAEKRPDPLEISLIELPRHRYALLIGVGRPCPDLPHFLHAEPDVEELGRTLVAAGWDKENVKVMTQNRTKSGKTSSPNRQNILTALNNLASQCKKKDTLLVALAGHQIHFNVGPEGNFFCPADSQPILENTLLPMQEVYDILSKCDAEVKLVLADGWQHSWQKAGVKPPGGVERRRGPEKYPNKVSVLYSCSVAGESFDHRDVRHGIFFHFVSRGLQGEADTDGQHGVITVKELADYLDEQIPQYVAANYMKQEQKPEIWLADGAGPQKLLTLSKGLKLFNEGYQYLEKKEYDQAIQAFDAAEKEAETADFVPLFVRRAKAYFHKGKQFSDAVIRDCNLALKHEPHCATAHGFLAEALWKQKSFEEAEKHYTTAIELEPAHAKGYYARAVMYTYDSKVKEAVQDLEKAIYYNPRLKEPYFWLGQLHEASEEYQKAAAALQTAVDLDPEWQEARQALDRVKKMLRE